MQLKTWSEQHQRLRGLIKNTAQHTEAIECALSLHAQVFPADMSGLTELTFEDLLWQGLNEWTARHGVNSKGRTVIYGLWHSARIEDITLNVLVANEAQVLDQSWCDRMNCPLRNTGNQLDSSEILKMSATLDLTQLRDYRLAVGIKTQQILRSLLSGSLQQKIPAQHIQRLYQEQAVALEPSASWLIDYWANKTVGGLLLMPATRHHVIHLNESIAAKKNGLRREKKLIVHEVAL